MKQPSDVVERIQKEMEEWEAKLEPLRLKAKLGEMETHQRFEKLEQSIKDKTRPVRTKLKELSSETGEAWKDIAEGCDHSWKEAKEAIKAAISRYTS